MSTRRKFLFNGSMAATALLVTKPFETIAGIAPSFTSPANGNKLVLLHTAFTAATGNSIRYVREIKRKNTNTIVLHAGQETVDNSSTLLYDAVITGEEYQIVNKGDIKTGIINARPGKDAIERVNELSGYLKNEKHCSIVVCMSPLGYKNEHGPDDLTLARKSSYIDIIIGGHAQNHHAMQVIALNSNDHEVILDSAFNHQKKCAKIEFSFDSKGNKNFVSLHNEPTCQD